MHQRNLAGSSRGVNRIAHRHDYRIRRARSDNERGAVSPPHDMRTSCRRPASPARRSGFCRDGGRMTTLQEGLPTPWDALRPGDLAAADAAEVAAEARRTA